MNDAVLTRLVERVGRGDADAFAELYSITCDDVRRVIASSLSTRPRVDIDDQLVAAYVRVWRQARTYPPGADAWGWVDATVRPVPHPDRHRVRPTLRTAARPTRRAVSNTSP